MNTLILHGWEGKSDSNWFFWLRNQLLISMDDIYIPNLPHTNYPVLSEQLEYISLYENDFKKGGCIIGHSLGCTLALTFIEEYNIKNVQIILVAPTYNGLTEELGREKLGDAYETLEQYYENTVNFEKINTLNNHFTILLSDNDPFINQESARGFFKNLKNCRFVECKNKGHFSSDTMKEFPEILEYIL